MVVHPVAAGGFAAAAPTYARIRPTYARGAIGAIKERTPRDGIVVDLAAGTGILSGQLVRARLDVVAVEPVEEMLVQLVRTLPQVAVVRGVAEALPVGDGRVDTLVAGEAFHWFDAPTALAEAARVLRPGGQLMLLWNRREESVDWVAQYGDIVVSERPEGRPYSQHRSWAEPVAAAGGFGEHLLERFDNPRPCGPQALVDRAASTSFVAAADPAARERVLSRVRNLAAQHPQLAGRDHFEIPYVTELWSWTRT
ncbi:MAG: class I SAM-dependent methyltransferase [Microthrixaceae bacterium]